MTKGSSRKQTERGDESYWPKFGWDRTSSEPDLSGHFGKRWPIKYPHEYITVDELKYFRRRQPQDLHTRSNVCLFDGKLPVLPFSSFKTEYNRRFKNPSLFFKPGLTRKSTSLKLEGLMDIETEHKSRYSKFSNDDILRSRASPHRVPENLYLSGDLELTPEYKSNFVNHPPTERRTQFVSQENFKIGGEFEMSKDSLDAPYGQDRQLIGEPAIRIDPPKCHLKLEGEMSYVPEYRSQYIEFPIEKSHSIPQLSNIKFQGSFIGVPEYTESFKCYDSYSKSAPIKKADHINFNGKIDEVPEYKAKFKEPIMGKTGSLKTEDHLHPNGEFSKDLPEYYESFKDPQVRKMPERGKCREPYLRLKGKIEFDPEYRSTYLDYPRSRPIVKKSVSSLRLSNNNRSPFDSPKKKFTQISPNKYHDPSLDLPLTCQPEYRKAKRDFMIKERPLTRKITESDGTVRTITKSYKENGNHDVETKNSINRGRKKFSPRRREESPPFKLTVENVDDIRGTVHKTAPKFGRRASISRNAHNIREKTGVIECNPKYMTKESLLVSSPRKKHGDDSSFLVLDEPCKKNAWMKKSWYEA